jgi:hypothetical protein
MNESYTTSGIVFPIAPGAIKKTPFLRVFVAIIITFWIVGIFSIREGKLTLDLFLWTLIMLMIGLPFLFYWVYALRKSEIIVTENGMIHVNYCGMTYTFKNASIQRKKRYWHIGNIDSFLGKIQIPCSAFPDLDKASVYVNVHN